MRLLRLLFVLCLSLWVCATAVLGDEFKLNNGDILRGQAVSFNDDGLVVRLDIGGHSPRISWSKITQETLQQLAKNPQAVKFVEPFIEVPPVSRDKEQKKKEIVVKAPPRAEQVAKPGIIAFIATPAGLAVALVLLLANVFAGYQIARYRRRPPAMVCALSAIFPVFAPAIVLSMPTAQYEPVEPAAGEGAEGTLAAGKSTTGPLAKVPGMASGLSIAQHVEKAGGTAAGQPQSFKRGEYTFNRRFIETKFPGFFRIVPSEAEKDLVLAVRTAKDEFVAKRVTRISSNEMHILLLRGSEMSVEFAAITELQIRHKDAKS
jgi:hypothetical protein